MNCQSCGHKPDECECTCCGNEELIAGDQVVVGGDLENYPYEEYDGPPPRLLTPPTPFEGPAPGNPVPAEATTAALPLAERLALQYATPEEIDHDEIRAFTVAILAAAAPHITAQRERIRRGHELRMGPFHIVCCFNEVEQHDRDLFAAAPGGTP